MKVYQILPNRYYGGELLLPDGTRGIPARTTRTPPPPAGTDQYLIWNGNGWLLTNTAPPPDPVLPGEEPTPADDSSIDPDDSSLEWDPSTP